MDTTKMGEYFRPETVREAVHIIGTGSVGSAIAEQIARLGIEKFRLYDFDIIESHNLCNQMFTYKDIRKSKVEATRDMILSINPEAEVVIYPEGWKGQRLDGYVFLAVDSIELRKEICKKNLTNHQIKAIFDFRTRLEDAQHYAADWHDIKSATNLIKTMEFTHEEADAATPKSACGRVLGVCPTVRAVVNAGVCNFINVARGKPISTMVMVNPFEFTSDVF